MPSGTDLLAALEEQLLRRQRSVFCFVDYDGTLAPLAPTPDQAVPLPGTAALLHDLAAVPGTRVALVSGRSIADVRRFLDVPDVYYVGLHGLEVSLPGGEPALTEAVGVLRAVFPAIKQQLERALAGRVGILIEDKGAALACHYRQASRSDAVIARQVVAAVVHRYTMQGVRFMLSEGHEVTEIRSPSANKGKAVCGLLAAHTPAALALYIGDDQTDEDAFALLPAESITIRVGPSTVETSARYRVDDPDAVRRVLETILEYGRQRVRRAP